MSDAQRIERARYLASSDCPDLYYRLEYPNGGTDPTASDPGARWSKPGMSFVNRTADCIAGAAWCGGWDRYQPVRFAHIYDGAINCDSMRLDAGGPARCFERLLVPVPGCMVVYGSVDEDHDRRWDRIGHIGTIVEVPSAWNGVDRRCWEALVVVDIAARSPARANQRTSGLPWYGADAHGVAKDAWFVRSTMTPDISGG